MPDAPAAEAPISPEVTGSRVRLRLADPDRRHHGVRIYQELQRPRDGIQACWNAGAWAADIPRPDLPGRPVATRFEYAFIVDHCDGGTSFTPDPVNPKRADGPFGPKSVVELPDYRQPSWVASTAAAADPPVSWSQVPLPRFDADLTVGLWSSPSTADGQPAPLLLVHDGPEYATFSGLLRLVQHLADTGEVGPLRVALMAPLPGLRNDTYSAMARYADSVAFTLMPWLQHAAPTPPGHTPAVMGASLGALAALHLAHRHPSRFGSLLLQSGSFFRHRTDPQERGFAHFDRVARFVGILLRPQRSTRPRRIAMTCGTVEENLANNQQLAAGLRAAGHQVTLREHPDAHSYTAWRDSLMPSLADVLGG